MKLFWIGTSVEHIQMFLEALLWHKSFPKHRFLRTVLCLSPGPHWSDYLFSYYIDSVRVYHRLFDQILSNQKQQFVHQFQQILLIIQCFACLLFWIIKFIAMSILFIGDRNRHFSLNRNKWADPSQQEQVNYRKKSVQEQYRHELFQQMKQQNQRKRKQIEKQRALDLKYEKMFYQQLADNQRKLEQQTYTSSYSPKSIHDEISVYSPAKRTPKKQYPVTLPPLSDSSMYRFKHARMSTEPDDAYSHLRGMQRLKTMNYHDREREESTQQFIESPQIRQKKLQEQLDTKLNEVYSLMAQSVKTLNSTEDSKQQIEARLSPIRLNLNSSLNRQYKVKYPEYVNQPNPQDDRNYYRLPSLAKDYRSEEQRDPPQSNWREWYAKEKLKELQQVYRNQLGLNHQNNSFNRLRMETPTFYRDS